MTHAFLTRPHDGDNDSFEEENENMAALALQTSASDDDEEEEESVEVEAGKDAPIIPPVVVDTIHEEEEDELRTLDRLEKELKEDDLNNLGALMDEEEAM